LRRFNSLGRDGFLAIWATWHIDVYDGILQGVVIAEIELKQESQELILPRWIGKEVTGDSFYKKINMRERALKAHRQRR
jgi:adenylate cyclase